MKIKFDAVQFLKNNKLDVIIILALFCFAFGVRSVPSQNFSNIYGFDSIWAARQTKYLITGEHSFPYDDMNTDYPYGRKNQVASEIGWWGLNAVTYDIAASVTGTAGFNYDLFGSIAAWMTALVGALAIPAIYLFGKYSINRTTGLLAALFLAVSTTHLSYAVFGHAENDAFGFTLFFLSLLSFVLVAKKKEWKYCIPAIAFFAWNSMTWISFQAATALCCATVFVYYIIYIVLRRTDYYTETPEKAETRKWMLYALACILPSIFFTHFIAGNLWEIYTIPFVGFTLLVCSIIEIYTNKTKITLFKNLEQLKKSPYALKLALIAVFILIIGALMYNTSIITTPLAFAGISIGGSPQQISDYDARMRTTIAEQNKIKAFAQRMYMQEGVQIPITEINFFNVLDYLSRGMGFGIVIWFAFLGAIVGLLKLMVMPFMNKEFRDNYLWDIFVVLFILYALIKLTERTQTTFFLAAPACFGAAYFFNIVIAAAQRMFAQMKKELAYIKVAILSIGIIMFFGQAVLIMPSMESFGSSISQEWYNTFKFIDGPNVSTGSVFAAWWDYGHWLNYFNGDKIKVNLDNIQDRPDIIYTIAKAFTTTQGTKCKLGIQDWNCPADDAALEEAELHALSLLKPLKTTHILIDKEIVGGYGGSKFEAIKTIANTELGMMYALPCGPMEDNKIGCQLNSQGEGIGFTTETWDALKKIEWPGAPLNLSGSNTRAFAREDSEGWWLYFSAIVYQQGLVPVPDAPVLYSFEQRLFFKDPKLKHVKLVYEDGWNVIYEINWTGVPDPVDSILPPS